MPHIPGTGRTRSTHRNRVRTTHDHAGYDWATGGVTQEFFEQILIDDVPASPVVIGGPGSPSGSLESVPPAVPTDLVLTSALGLDIDGRSILQLIATLTQPTDTDLFGSYVEFTADNDGNPDPGLVAPIWTNAAIVLIGREATAAAIEGVRGLTQYWARAWAVDMIGNRSDYTAIVTHTTVKDDIAPGMPQNVVASGGFKGLGAHWSPSQAADLMFYDIRYAIDDGSGTGPATDQWVSVRARTNTIWIDALTINVKYWLQVRSVDFSGNVVTSDVDPTAVDYLVFPEAGWTVAVQATPNAVGASDVAFNSVITDILFANRIDAGTITTGILKVNTTDGNMADGIEIYTSGGLRIGKWDETGLYIGKTADGLPADLSASDYVRVTDAGLTVYLNGVSQAAITPDGINASAVNFGALPGGHNLLQNSSFELADFTSAASTKTWDASGDFTGTQIATVNVTTSGGLAQTASTY